MGPIDWRPLAERLRPGRMVVLGTHIDADGDGLGCQIALHWFLTGLGLRTAMINNEPAPEKFGFLRGSGEVQAYDRAVHSSVIRGADLFIILDNSSVQRLAALREDVEATRALKVCIDHHSTVNPFWDLNCVDTDACASGELVYRLIRHMGGRFTPEIADALYVSFVTDTGHFRFSKTTPETHRIVAELMEIARISPHRVYREVYENTSRGMAAVTGLALTSLRFELGGRFAWMRLTREEIAASRAELEDTGDLVNQALAIRGVQAGALFREMPDGAVKVSLRSRGDIDVHALAARFGGGGHKNAAGILLEGPLDKVIREVLAAAGALFPAEGKAAGAGRRGRP